MIQLSPHFTLAELCTTEVRHLARTNLAEAAGYLPALRATAALLEEIRALLGDKPIVVNSGFRGRRLNEHIGGAKSSQHLIGEAADIRTPGTDLRVAFDAIRQSSISYGQLILEDGDGDGIPTWIHVSLGPPWRPASRSRQALTYDGLTSSPA